MYTIVTIQREHFITINMGKHVETLSKNKIQQLVEEINEGINEDIRRKLALVIGTVHDYSGIKTPAIVLKTEGIIA